MITKFVKRVLTKGDTMISKLCSRSRLLSSLYYSFFNSSFRREQQAVLMGRIRHLEEVERKSGNYFLLIRNTHRLEKGLLMRPKRPVFGKDFIGETVETFGKIWSAELLESNQQMKWFHDVLFEYFATSGPDPFIDRMRSVFFEIIDRNESSNKISEPNCKSIPYKRTIKEKISYEDFLDLSKQRRSVRWYLPTPVHRDLIDKAINVANQAPTACNRQPFEFRVFDDPSLVEKVVSLPMGTKGYGHSIPVIIVVVGNLDAYFSERDRHIIYIDASLAAMSLMFALETLGLASCAINWPDIEAREIKMANFLKLGEHQRPIMCIGLGYPDPEGMVAFSEKRPINEIRKYN